MKKNPLFLLPRNTTLISATPVGESNYHVFSWNDSSVVGRLTEDGYQIMVHADVWCSGRGWTFFGSYDWTTPSSFDAWLAAFSAAALARSWPAQGADASHAWLSAFSAAALAP